jgi:PAS domain S-box-containing protein
MESHTSNGSAGAPHGREALEPPLTLDDHRRLLAMVVRSAPIVLWAIDNNGVFLLSEGRGLDALGLEPGEVVGESAFDLYLQHPEVLEDLRRALDGESVTSTVEVGDLTFDTRSSPMRDAEGNQTGVIGVSTDVTDRESAARDLARSREETIRRLTRAVEERSHETAGHIERMSRVSALLAEKMGFAENRIELIRVASPMHDVGKIAIPDEVLMKPAALDRWERRVMQRHAEIGHTILGGSEAELLRVAADIAWTHHERFDGEGYPRGLAGEEITLEGRIAAVADVFDAITHDRVYRTALPFEQALEVMRAGRGSHFDPDVLDTFFGAVDEIETIESRNGQPVAG